MEINFRVLLISVIGADGSSPRHNGASIFGKRRGKHFDRSLGASCGGGEKGRYPSAENRIPLFQSVASRSSFCLKNVKFIPVHTMNVYGGNRCIDPLILNHDTLWRYVVNFTPRPLYPGKN